MKLLSKKRMRTIITDFVQKCSEPIVKNFGFDESFWETTDGCEDTWEDDDSEQMKRSLIENYLLQFGYHNVFEDNKNALTEKELIDKYFAYECA